MQTLRRQRAISRRKNRRPGSSGCQGLSKSVVENEGCRSRLGKRQGRAINIEVSKFKPFLHPSAATQDAHYDIASGIECCKT
jgi:hypothetical protein